MPIRNELTAYCIQQFDACSLVLARSDQLAACYSMKVCKE